MRRPSPATAAALFAFFALVRPRPGLASPTFPAVVQGELGLSYTPECTLCHSSSSGGFGTATTPVGSYLRSRGARALDTGALRTALTAMVAERHDSDGDGIADVDELRAGTDPNAPGGQALSPPPEFGCGARVAGGRHTRGAAAVIVVIGALACFRRGRRPLHDASSYCAIAYYGLANRTADPRDD